MHKTTLVAAEVSMPPAHERGPLQVRSHWLPEQLTAEAQLPSVSQTSSVEEAVLVTVP